MLKASESASFWKKRPIMMVWANITKQKILLIASSRGFFNILNVLNYNAIMSEYAAYVMCCKYGCIYYPTVKNPTFLSCDDFHSNKSM